MISIIPSVKSMEIKPGFLKKRAIYYDRSACHERLCSILKKLPYDEEGTGLEIAVTGDSGEAYELWIGEQDICIKASGLAGAFYAVQTLRQIWKHKEIPCLYIKDWPDFAYRGFYHDVTRGKIPKVETVKKLVDEMAYYKLNSLQLYVEHVFEFEECKDLHKNTGCFTKEEIREIGAYCKQNFIEFIPSLSTFGHLYELLQQKQYQHLRVNKEFQEYPNFWQARMRHHTIDPLQPESLSLIKSLIDQYAEYFDSGIFNICCDETFDLNIYGEKGYEVGELYVDFAKRIIDHVKGKDKKVMMWADILLKHPETIEALPEDIYFLNWNYKPEPPEEKIKKFAELHRKQIVCPGTSTWSRLCENVEVEEQNIIRMAEYGYEHGAIGILNTNWGDYGNPCSLELAMYGMVLGAEKSWSVESRIGENFYHAVNILLYENENGLQYLKELSSLHDFVHWNSMCCNYFKYRFDYGEQYMEALKGDLQKVHKAYVEFSTKLSGERWIKEEFRQEMLIAAEGICVMAELCSKMDGKVVDRVTDAKEWLKKYRAKWLEKNKESELRKIEEMFLYCEEH